VRQVGHLPELHRDARSTKHKTTQETKETFERGFKIFRNVEILHYFCVSVAKQ
jgi:hypothetical protein